MDSIVKTKKNNQNAIIIIGILFFIFGFVTWLNGTLIPFLKIICELKTDTQAFLVVTASYMAYFFLAIPSSFILKFTGYKKGMALGLIIMVVGTLLFLPAAANRNFTIFLIGLFSQGAGLALLQTAANPYISILGPIESAAKRISIMGISNKIAGVLSPLILSTLLLSNIENVQIKLSTTINTSDKNNLLTELSNKIRMPYLIMAIVLIILAIVIFFSSLPEINDKETVTQNENKSTTNKSIFKYPHLWMGVLSIFLYVGTEVLAGDAIGIYGNAMGMPLNETRYFTSFTLTGMLIGYLIGIVSIPKLISQQDALKFASILGIFLTIAIYVTHGYLAIFFIAMLGLANSLMWPAIFPLAINKLGEKTKIGSALLIMGIAGGAILPLIFATLKSIPKVGYKLGFFLCLLPAYLVILYYSLKGYKLGMKNYK
ncbi:sugar MFS transporter [Hydrotalea sandarakina]|jgi:glucose/galactose transporter|uniref:Glucose/galactose transporter n=1 Tax=Hydrotalea sandarakina TaxID=1004304 RepID=A0A2W7TNC2_9BACT|nr:sugar MFS transporter [Hydrotalea sandarakina]PZX64662.1 glucose/galactose transporter [Hydrotalea sandarakina]